MSETVIIAVANQKGGVGKTTTTANLGIGLANAGAHVLLIDCDPQGSLTLSLGHPDLDQLDFTLSNALDLLMQRKPLLPGQGLLHHPEGVDLLPANIDLAATEVAIAGKIARESFLTRYINTVRDRYTHILIDCPPSLNMLSINALAAANRVLIPVQPEYLPVKGLDELLKTISNIREAINPSLMVEGILPTMVNSRTVFSKEVLSLLRNNYNGYIRVFDTEIPHSVRAKEVSLEGCSIFKYDPKGKVAAAYRSLTEEVLNNESERTRYKAEQTK